MTTAIERGLEGPGPARDLLAFAAVRERCVPTALLSDWIERHPDAESSDVLEAMETVIDLETVGTPALAADGASAVELPESLRLEILKRIGLEATRRSLAASGSATLTETTFRALLEHRPPSVEAAPSRDELAALGTAVQWANSLGVATSIDAVGVDAAISRFDFLEAIGGAELHRFVGRERTLQTLHQIWRVPPARRETVLIEGPGGIGKSLTVARFLADLLGGSDPRETPNAIFLLDFERLDLQRARVSTMFSEIVRQAARWWAPEYAQRLTSLALELSTSDIDFAGSSLRSAESFRDEGSIADLIVEAFAGHGTPHVRFVIFVDTFEEVESFDDAASASVRTACELLRGAGADVMEIYASRHFAAPQRLRRRRSPTHIQLRRMTQRESLRFLRQEAARIGIRLDKETADAAQRKLGGWPLDLRFAIALMGDLPHRFGPDRWLRDLETSPRRRQATLYERVLARIRDRNVRKLAKPGLLLRRLTAPILAQVLAGPCGLDVDEASAEGLLASARRLGQLFVIDPSDPEALWHRRDVRSLMFGDLRHDIEPAVARAIHAGAIAFYESSDDPRDRAEELYHRFQLGEPLEVIEARWIPEAGQRLKPSLDELPPEGAAWLRGRLGAASVAAPAADFAPVGAVLDSRTEELRLAARKRLQSGDAAVGDILAAAGAPESALSLFGDIYAEALVLQGRSDEAVAEAAMLRTSRAPIPGRVRVGVYACAAGVLEGQGRWREAFDFWKAAQRAGVRQPIGERLTFAVGALRSSRHLGLHRGRGRRLQSAVAMALEMDSQLFEHRVAAREVAAELGEFLYDSPPGSNLVGFLTHLVTFLLDVNEVFVQADRNPARRAEIAMRLGLQGQEWTQQALNDIARRLIYGSEPNLHHELVSIMREEVDWALFHAVNRSG